MTQVCLGGFQRKLKSKSREYMIYQKFLSLWGMVAESSTKAYSQSIGDIIFSTEKETGNASSSFFSPFQHHDNVSQSWAPKDVRRAPRVCRMWEKDPRQVNLIGIFYTFDLGLSSFSFQNAREQFVHRDSTYLIFFTFTIFFKIRSIPVKNWGIRVQKIFRWLKKSKDASLGRPSASLAPLLISILFLFQILTQSPRHVLAWGLLKMWMLWLSARRSGINALHQRKSFALQERLSEVRYIRYNPITSITFSTFR